MSSPYWVQLYVKTVFNSIFIDFMTFFYELTWFSTATRGLCSVTSKMCVEIMESLSESRLCQSDNLKMTFSRVKMHFQGFLDILHQCSTFVSPETRMWSLPSHLHSELNSLAMCVKSAISGHVFLPRIQWHIFVGWTCYCIVLLWNAFIYCERSARLQLKPVWLLSNKQLSKWRKKIITL